MLSLTRGRLKMMISRGFSYACINKLINGFEEITDSIKETTKEQDLALLTTSTDAVLVIPKLTKESIDAIAMLNLIALKYLGTTYTTS